MTKKDKKLIKEWQKALKNNNKPIFKSLLERFLFSLCVQEGIVKYPSKKDLKKRYFKDKI